MREKLVVNLFVIIVLNLFLLNVHLIYGQELKVTGEHPFLIDGNWIPAKELVVGNKLKTLSGEKAIITKITKIVPSEIVRVYNLEAGEYHNFVVNDDLVVHNSNKPLLDLMDLFNPDESYLKDFKDVNSKSPNALKYNDILNKPVDELTADEKGFAMDYAKEVLMDKGLVDGIDYLYEKVTNSDTGEVVIALRILPKEGNNVEALQNVAQRSSNRGVGVYVFPIPLNQQAMASYNIRYNALCYSLDSLYNRDIFKSVTKHEFEHLISFHTAFLKFNPSARDLANVVLFKGTNPVKVGPFGGYDEWIADELFARWGELVLLTGKLPKKPVTNFECITHEIASITLELEKINNFASQMETMSVGFKEVLDNKMFNPRINKELNLEPDRKLFSLHFGENAEPWIAYRLKENAFGKYLEVIIQLESSETAAFSLPNNAYVQAFENVFDNGVLDKNMLIGSLIKENYGVQSQLKYLIESARHTRIAVAAAKKELVQIFLNANNPNEVSKRLCNLRSFVARTQLARGSYSSETGKKAPLPLTQRYIPEDVPDISTVLDRFSLTGCCDN